VNWQNVQIILLVGIFAAAVRRVQIARDYRRAIDAHLADHNAHIAMHNVHIAEHDVLAAERLRHEFRHGDDDAGMAVVVAQAEEFQQHLLAHPPTAVHLVKRAEEQAEG
jgi:hypothetical protein